MPAEGEMRAPPSERNTTRLACHRGRYSGAPARAPAAGALHHQRGGADLHRQHAAGGRRGAVDDDRAEGGAGVRRARRRAAGQSRHLRSGAAEGVARGASASPTRPAFPGCSIRCSSTARRRARRSPRRCVAQKPRALRLNARRVRRAVGGGKTDDAALARFAKARRTVVGADRRARSRPRRRAPRARSPTAIR